MPLHFFLPLELTDSPGPVPAGTIKVLISPGRLVQTQCAMLGNLLPESWTKQNEKILGYGAAPNVGGSSSPPFTQLNGGPIQTEASHYPSATIALATWPTIYCNSLGVRIHGHIQGHQRHG